MGCSIEPMSIETFIFTINTMCLCTGITKINTHTPNIVCCKTDNVPAHVLQTDAEFKEKNIEELKILLVLHENDLGFPFELNRAYICIKRYYGSVSEKIFEDTFYSSLGYFTAISKLDEYVASLRDKYGIKQFIKEGMSGYKTDCSERYTLLRMPINNMFYDMIVYFARTHRRGINL